MGGINCVIFAICLTMSGSNAAVTSNYKCSGTQHAGESTYNSYTSEGVDNNLAFSYMVESPDYDFDCCGKITQWQGNVGNIGVLQFQVWRKQSKFSYIMIGENSVYLSSTGDFTYSVDSVDQIVVNKGDFMGWHSAGKEMVQYAMVSFTSSSYATMFRRINLGDLYTGDTYNWSNIEAYNDRRYAIKATYVASDIPTVTVTTPVTIPDYIQSGATVTRVTWSDAQTSDNSSLNVYFQTGASYLTMDFPSPAGTGTGYLTASNSLRPRGKTLTYYVYDTCYMSDRVTQTITVQQTEIIIDTLPATVTVNETGISEQLLHTVTCTEPTDQWYCKSTWSTAYPFILKAITTSSYGLYKVEHSVLDYDNKQDYLGLNVECVENRVSDTNTATSSIDVYINKNQPPSFTNLDAHVIVSANESHKGDTVFTVSATDPEGDDLTFTASYASQYGVFLVTQNGAVQVIAHLVPYGNLSYTITVTVTDTAGNIDTGYLVISLNNTNYPEFFLNTPSETMQVSENSANFTFLYRFTYQDMDQYDTKIYSLSFNHNKMTNYFSINFATGELRTRYVDINFEDLGSVFTYTATVMVGDPKGSATTTFLIEILNENEAPRFTKNHFVIEADEAADNTQIDSGTTFSTDMVDEDSSEAVNAESHEYVLNCSADTHRFYMTPSSGEIVYKGPYDIDVSGTPTDVDCQITVVDKYGLSSTAGLYIHVKNVNEFQPEFTQKIYQAYVATNTLIGKDLLTVSAIDHDNSDDDDNVITYSVDQSGGNFSLLINIDHNGVIYAAQSFASYSAGETLGPIILQASNYNVASRTGTATISLVIPQSTTTVTTTTDRNLGFYEDNRNYMWLILSIIGIAVMLLALSLVLFRICHLARIRPWCYACCMRGICCRPKPEGPRGFGDKGYDLASFGHKQRYTDEEIDGWLKTDERKRPRSWAKQPEVDDIDGWIRKTGETPSYRQPFNDTTDDGESDARYADQPLYEMFRIPDNVPSKASYDDPSVSRWKKRSSKRPY